MENRKIKVNLHVNPELPLVNFGISNYFEFDPQCETGFYTFTNDPSCERDNLVLMTENPNVFLNERIKAIVSSSIKKNYYHYGEELIPVLNFHNLTEVNLFPVMLPGCCSKSNFIFLSPGIDSTPFIEKGIPFTYIENVDASRMQMDTVHSLSVSCYAICATLEDAIRAICYRSVPIMTEKLPFDMPFFRYEESEQEDIFQVISKLSPRSYFMEAEKTLDNIASLMYHANVADYLFCQYTEYFMTRVTVEVDPTEVNWSNFGK